MSHHLKIALPEPVVAQLSELAEGTGQRPATLAAEMVRDAVARAAKAGYVRSLKPAPTIVRRANSSRAPWLEPYGGDATWRAQMWGAIVALHGRYPRALATLKDQWWFDEAHTETLCAFAVWRNELDDGGQDPREELAFQSQLADYSRVLRELGGGVTTVWRPGSPPAEWTGH